METSGDFFVRDYLPADFAAVEQFWDENGLGGLLRGDNARIVDQTLSAGGHLLLLCNSGGHIIGTSWLTNDKRRTYLHHFGIAAPYRGKGLSKFLLQVSLKRAVKDGLQIKIEVHRNSEIALHLYRGAGFKPLGDYDVYIIRNLSEVEGRF